MKTTCRKSWPGNLFHVLNLTFDPCFKVVTLKHLISPLLLVLWLQIVKTDHEKQRLWSKDCKRLPYVYASVCASVRLSGFNISLNISFIYKDIFIKFAGNVYGYKNLSLQNSGFILKTKMAAIANCLKIIKLF